MHLGRRHWDIAASTARRGLRMLGGDRLRGGTLLRTLVDAELGRDDMAAAAIAASQLTALAADCGVPALQAQAALARGRVSAARQDTDRAVSELEAGLASLGPAGWPLLRADLHLALARVLEEQAPGAARAEARAARSIYEPLGAPDLADVAAILGDERLAKHAQRRPRTAAGVLSRREAEVLDEVATGRANADIASRLHLSTRTVEHHVSSILGKLGLRSRAEAVAYAVATHHDPSGGDIDAAQAS